MWIIRPCYLPLPSELPAGAISQAGNITQAGIQQVGQRETSFQTGRGMESASGCPGAAGAKLQSSWGKMMPAFVVKGLG